MSIFQYDREPSRRTWQQFTENKRRWTRASALTSKSSDDVAFMCFNTGSSYFFGTHFPGIPFIASFHMQSEVFPLHLACFHKSIFLELKPFILVVWFWHASQEVALFFHFVFPHCTLQASPIPLLPHLPHVLFKDQFHSSQRHGCLQTYGRSRSSPSARS